MREGVPDQARAEPGWEVFEHWQGGRLAGFSMLKGTEYHRQLGPRIPAHAQGDSRLPGAAAQPARVLDDQGAHWR